MESIFELLQNTSLLAKTVGTDNQHVDFILNQLEDPKNFRPLKNLTSNHHREMYYDPKKDSWQARTFTRPREYKILEERKGTYFKKPTQGGHPKDTLYTKKTSVTLLPPHAKIEFYQPSNKQVVGFLFDINACHLKNEKYIFPKMADTDKRWWLYRPHHINSTQKSISLQTLRTQLSKSAQHDQILAPNELLLGLSLKALVGIFSPLNTRQSRLQALLVQQRVKERFNLNLPIFIITSNGMQTYLEQQAADIHESRIVADPLLQQLSIDYQSLLTTKSSFPLEQLVIQAFDVSTHVLSFLTLSDLAKFSRSNSLMRSKMNADSSKFLWHNLTSRNINIPPHIQNKHDIGLYYQISRQSESLEFFARRDFNHAFRIMQSQLFSQQLPLPEQQLSRPSSGSILQKIFGAVVGFFIGLISGLVMAIALMIQAQLRSIMSFAGGACLFKTSFPRSILGATVLPIFSVAKSAWYGAFFGWKYGLRPLPYLMEGLHIFHHELYYGVHPSSSAHDPWSCCTPYEETISNRHPTNIKLFFKEKCQPDTIAEIAVREHARKPRSLRYQAPHCLPTLLTSSMSQAGIFNNRPALENPAEQPQASQDAAAFVSQFS